MFTYPMISAGGSVGDPPVIESYTLANNGNASLDYVTIPMPSGIVAGDLLLMWGGISHSSIGGPPNWAAVTAAGWNQVEEATGANQGSMTWYWRVATGDEDASYDIGGTGTNFRRKGGCLRVSGCDTTTPYNARAIGVSASASSLVIPSLAHTAVNSTSVILGGGSYNNAAGGTYTESDSNWSFGGQQASSYGNVFWASGPTATESVSPSFTLANAASWAGYYYLHLVLNPA